MQKIAKPLALLALVATILPPILFLAKSMAEGPMKWIMLAGSILWFATAPFWLKEND